eukprot:2642379-Pleurochrysis_carterae.AAC.1
MTSSNITLILVPTLVASLTLILTLHPYLHCDPKSNPNPSSRSNPNPNPTSTLEFCTMSLTPNASQSSVVAQWFQGKELAMALGVNLSFSRLGSVRQRSPALQMTEPAFH